MFKTTALLSVLFMLPTASTFAQTDLFWSFKNLNGGAENGFAEEQFEIGETGSLFLYFDPMNTDLDTGCFLDVSTNGKGVINFIGGESLCFDVNVGETPITVRWGDIFGPGTVSPDGQLFMMNASAIVTGTGMLSSNTGPVFVDQGFDFDAGAFLFARVDFEIIGEGTVDIILEIGSGGIVNNGMSVFPSFGEASITGGAKILFGDVNLDGFVTLLDLNPFIDLIQTQGFQIEADLNQDGSVDLLDVAPFIDAIQFP